MCCYIHVFYIPEPGDIGMVDVTCSAVDVINQCVVTWNVSGVILYGM